MALIFGVAVAFALAAADRARRREGSPFLWGGLTFLVCAVWILIGGLLLEIPAGIGMVLAAAKAGKTTKACPSCGKITPIDSLACIHCGASPRARFGGF